MVIDRNTLLVHPSTIYTRPLDQYLLAINTAGTAGLGLLNATARQFWQQFQQPCTATEALATVNHPSEGPDLVNRLLELQLLQPAGAHPRLVTGRPETLTAWAHVSDACNLRCPHCFVPLRAEQMALEKGQQAVEAVFRSAIAHEFKRVKLKYAGGEATLNFKVVLALHDYAQLLAQQHGVELDGVVLTNGVYLPDLYLEALQQRALRLMISLDGIGPAHDAQRPLPSGAGSFDRVERTLDRVQTTDVPLSISITLTNRNLYGAAETVRYVLARRLPFSLNFYRENECSSLITDLNYDDEQIIVAMRAIFAVIESDIPPYSLLDRLLDRARLDLPHVRPCGVGVNYMAISSQGNIARCHMHLDQQITDVTAPDPLKLIRADTLSVQNPSVEEKEGCRDCTWRYWCAGGCPALTYRRTGRFDVKSPNCHIYQALFPDVLRLEALRILRYTSP